VKICSNQVYAYHLIKQNWEMMLNSSKTVVQGRANHASVIAENFLCVFGGYNYQSLILSHF